MVTPLGLRAGMVFHMHDGGVWTLVRQVLAFDQIKPELLTSSYSLQQWEVEIVAGNRTFTRFVSPLAFCQTFNPDDPCCPQPEEA